MLQSKPPSQRNGVPFRGFTEVLLYIVKNEGILRLCKGLVPQIVKGLIVQGLMMMLKERLVFFIENIRVGRLGIDITSGLKL